MEPKSTPPKFKDVYRRHEFAPLVALAMTVADLIKKYRADRSEKHRIAGVEAPARGENTSR